MANISFRGAVSAIVEALEWRKDEILADFIGDDPDNVFYALEEWAREALSQYIDNGLIYTADILELWDGSTNENVYVEQGDDLMQLVTQSVYFQLGEDWAEAIYDGIDEWLTSATGHEDRADALSALTWIDEAKCPACGEDIQYCQGHGEIGDPVGAAILAAHDEGDHSQCVLEACE